jgi:hypothetical protein
MHMTRTALVFCLAFAGVATFVPAATAETIHVTGTRTGPKGEVHFDRTRSCENGTCTITGKETDSKGNVRTYTITKTR